MVLAGFGMQLVIQTSNLKKIDTTYLLRSIVRGAIVSASLAIFLVSKIALQWMWCSQAVHKQMTVLDLTYGNLHLNVLQSPLVRHYLNAH